MKREAAQRRWVLVATILGSSMAFIDGSVVNIALPVLRETMGASLADVQWVVEAYTLFLAALMLTGGALGDRFGRTRIFAIGVAIFAAASVACGLAPTIHMLVAFRGAQGVGAALMVPGSLAIISATFPDAERGKAIGTWSAFTSITMVAGPLLGGVFIDHASWRAIFFINVPVAAAVLWIAWRRMPETRDRKTSALDPVGAVLATAGLGTLVFGLIESKLVIAAGGLALLAGFVVAEKRVAAPMMPLRLFRSAAFCGANLLTLFLYAALSGGLFLVPMNLIQVHGLTATQAGAAIVPVAVLLFALSRWVGRIADRVGPRRFLVVGPVVAAIGFALFVPAGEDTGYWRGFFPGFVVMGLGMALTVAPLTTTVMSAVERAHAGIASGINNAISETAGLLAVAAVGFPMAMTGSFLEGFRLVMVAAAALALASALCAWIVLRGQPATMAK